MSQSNGSPMHTPNVEQRCPTCGEKLEAAVVLYVRDVVLVDGRIDQWQLAYRNDLEASLLLDDERVRLYCPNDHDLTDMLVKH